MNRRTIPESRFRHRSAGYQTLRLRLSSVSVRRQSFRERESYSAEALASRKRCRIIQLSILIHYVFKIKVSSVYNCLFFKVIPNIRDNSHENYNHAYLYKDFYHGRFINEMATAIYSIHPPPLLQSLNMKDNLMPLQTYISCHYRHMLQEPFAETPYP